MVGSSLAPLLTAAVLFGAMAVAVRVAAAEMAALQIVFFRFAGSLLVLLAATRGRDLRPQPGNLPRVLLRGLFGAAAISLYFVGIEGAGAGLASLLQSTYPVFASALAAVVLGEAFTGRVAGAVALNLAGAALVVGAELPEGTATSLGLAAAMGSAVLSGVAIVTARHLRHSENASLITTYFMAVGALCTAPSLLEGLPPPSVSLVASVAIVVSTSVAAQWLLHHALGFVPAAGASLVAATGVLTATLIEAVWFGESVRAGTIAGGTLMIAAIGLASRAPAEPRALGAHPRGDDARAERGFVDPGAAVSAPESR